MQIYAAFLLTMVAGQLFSFFEIRFDLHQVLVINNIVVAFLLGLLGLSFFRWRLKTIEIQVI